MKAHGGDRRAPCYTASMEESTALCTLFKGVSMIDSWMLPNYCYLYLLTDPI
jgi:hypothetical protein